MDDYLDSAKTEDEIIERATQVKDILSQADFHLTKWMSNSTTVMKAFQAKPGEDRQVLLTEEDAEKILEVCWKPFTDTMTLKTINVNDVKYTRRGLLKKISTIFDPLGFTAPLTIKAKLKLKLLSTRELS